MDFPSGNALKRRLKVLNLVALPSSLQVFDDRSRREQRRERARTNSDELDSVQTVVVRALQCYCKGNLPLNEEFSFPVLPNILRRLIEVVGKVGLLPGIESRADKRQCMHTLFVRVERSADLISHRSLCVGCNLRHPVAFICKSISAFQIFPEVIGRTRAIFVHALSHVVVRADFGVSALIVRELSFGK